MQQLEIEFFFPLTEQIPLDLDFTPSEEYAKKLREEHWAGMVTTSFLIPNGGAVTMSKIEPCLQFDIDQTPITVVSKNKPNIIKKFVYRMLGLKWKVK